MTAGEGKTLLEDVVWNVYTKFKLHFYLQVFGQFQGREASLTTVETYCAEVIQALGEPTINEFATFLNISQPNAAYKVGNLIKKGYVDKVQSEDDKREYHLRLTQKYMNYYAITNRYVCTVMERVTERFPPEDCRKLEQMLRVISLELMPEVAYQDTPMPEVVRKN